MLINTPLTNMTTDKMSPAGKQKKRMQSSHYLNTTSRTVKIKPNIGSNWHKPATETINYVMDVIDTNMETTLSTVDARCYKEVHNLLTALKKRFKVSILRKKVPCCTVKNYHALEHLITNMNMMITSKIHKVQKMDNKIEQAERLTDELQQEEEKLKQKICTSKRNNLKETTCENNTDDYAIKLFETAINSMIESNNYQHIDDA